MANQQPLPGIREWDTAQGWRVVELHYKADPEKNVKGWKESTKRALGLSDADWDREFEIDWTAGLGDCYFDKDSLRTHYLPRAGGAHYRGVMIPGKGKGDIPEFVTQAGGAVTVWRLPERITGGVGRKRYLGRYIIGADPAEGLEKGDAAAAYVLDRVRFEIVAAVHGRLVPDAFAMILDRLGRWYSEPDLGPHEVALLGVEANNHGNTVLNVLSRTLRYPKLYAQTQQGGGARRLGWFTSSRTKPLVIDGLAKVVAEKELVIHDKALLGEMMTYISKDGKLGAAGSSHDDRVMAAAIAVQLHKMRYTPQVHVPKENGMFAKMRQAGQGGDSWVAV